jgi:hypothetical protein
LISIASNLDAAVAHALADVRHDLGGEDLQLVLDFTSLRSPEPRRPEPIKPAKDPPNG